MRISYLAVTKLAVAALVLTALVFVPVSSQAETVTYEGNTATGIKDLECGEDVFYDVTFVFDVGTAVYGEPPGDFPFETLPDGTTREEGTYALASCIKNALNAAPVAITRVGPHKEAYFFIAVAEGHEAGDPEKPWFYGAFESRYYDTVNDDIQRPPETWVTADNFHLELFPPGPGFDPIDYDGIPFGARGLPQDVQYSWAKIETAADSPLPPNVDIGGSVTGLTGTGLVLQNNGADDEEIMGFVFFIFDTQVTAGTGYSVTVKTQPSNPAQKCTVARGSGTAPAGGVDDVLVTCTDPPVSDEVPWPAVYFVLGL